MGDSTIADRTDEVECPRCHEKCGWCSDYRWMHGKIKLPGSRKKCTIPGLEPEGDACPVCHGTMRVKRTVTYSPTPEKTPHV